MNLRDPFWDKPEVVPLINVRKILMENGIIINNVEN